MSLENGIPVVSEAFSLEAIFDTEIFSSFLKAPLPLDA